MAIVQISQIQLRRGLQQDLPQLASAEMGWSVDTRRLFIGNGTLAEGAPSEGVTEILTANSDLLSFFDTYTFKGLAAGFEVVTGPDSLHPVVRTLQDKLDDIVSIKDFGATGNGVDDDTAAIQRAMDRVFATNQIQLLSNKHRTILFPSGNYVISATLNIPPFIRLQGEGKRTSIISGSFAGALAQFVDSFGQSGSEFGGDDEDGNTPDIAEYHLADLGFEQLNEDYNQSCVLIDGCYTATFSRCMFRGITPWVQPDAEDGYGNGSGLDYFTSDRGTGIAGVCMNNASIYQQIRNVSFTQCDFFDINYGIEINGETLGTSINTCYFDHNYHNIVIGRDSPAYNSFGITIQDNYFRYSSHEAIYCGEACFGVMSNSNMFTGSGLADYVANNPVEWQGHAVSPVITFNSDGNYSTADSCDRSTTDFEYFPNIELNDYDCIVTNEEKGLILGHYTTGIGYATTLTDSASFTDSGVKYIPPSYQNLTFDYTLTHNNQQRSGVLRASRIGGSYVYDEEYNETGETYVTFRVNPGNGDVEYISSATGDSVNLTYNLRYHKPIQ